MSEDEVKAGIRDMIARERTKSYQDVDLIDDLLTALSLFSNVGDSRTVDGLWEIVARRGLYEVAIDLLGKGCRDGFRLVTDYDAVMEAVAAGDMRMVRLLVENSFELNNVTHANGESAFFESHSSALSRSLRCARPSSRNVGQVGCVGGLECTRVIVTVRIARIENVEGVERVEGAPLSHFSD